MFKNDYCFHINDDNAYANQNYYHNNYDNYNDYYYILYL